MKCLPFCEVTPGKVECPWTCARVWDVAGEGLPGIWEAGEGGVDRLTVALRALLLLLLLLPQAGRRHNGKPGKCQKHSAWQHLSFISGQHSGFGGGQVGHHFCQNFLFDLLTFITLCSSQKDDECVKKGDLVQRWRAVCPLISPCRTDPAVFFPC